MQSARAMNRGARLAVGVLLMAAFLALAGCSATAASPTHANHKPAVHTPTPKKTASHYTTQSTSAAYVYKDGLAGYAVTFPSEPIVEPLAINGTDRLANYASFGDDQSMKGFIARGEVRDSPPNLRGELFGWLQSVKTSGQIGASSYELGGLSALQAEFTLEGGQKSATVVASDGNRFYQLIVLGGTPEQAQAFFDSFSLTDG